MAVREVRIVREEEYVAKGSVRASLASPVLMTASVSLHKMDQSVLVARVDVSMTMTALELDHYVTKEDVHKELEVREEME